ncbi:recombinase family protein [Streptomyces sp. NPDC048496]|uniref:recombinase family protein n=1 Tax=Streptomyces sp. NPDC048496 TaxID=3365558 RepID=UPI003717C8A4
MGGSRDLLVCAEGIFEQGIGAIGRRVLSALLPARRSRVSARKVKSPISRYAERKLDGRPDSSGATAPSSKMVRTGRAATRGKHQRSPDRKVSLPAGRIDSRVSADDPSADTGGTITNPQAGSVGNLPRESTSMNGPADGFRHMLVGYCRTSTADQHSDHQVEALLRQGVQRDNSHVDVAAGAKASRPELDRVIAVAA